MTNASYFGRGKMIQSMIRAKIGLPCRESESRRAHWSQPIATITNPAPISTVAAIDIAIQAGSGLSSHYA
jgi:hypothetical protein